MKKWVFGCAMALVITSCDNKKFSIQGRVAYFALCKDNANEDRSKTHFNYIDFRHQWQK